MKVSKETIIRTVVLLLALINSLLVSKGKNIIPFSDEEVAEIVSWIFTAVASIWAWWKNNSFTDNAIQADKYLNDLREGVTINDMKS